jgi:hypothetical protein
LLHLILPRTDAGVAVQVLVTLLIGVPLVLLLYRRRASTEIVWFVGGVVVLLLGLYALRTIH